MNVSYAAENRLEQVANQKQIY